MSLEKEIKVNSLRETQKVARQFAQELLNKTALLNEGAILVGLTGDLGAGKTSFVQGMALGMGIRPDHYVTSPTFTLINEYPAPVPLIHVDLYRLGGVVELATLGLEEYFVSRTVVVIEWVEKAPSFKERLHAEVSLEILGDQSRKIRIVHPNNFASNATLILSDNRITERQEL